MRTIKMSQIRIAALLVVALSLNSIAASKPRLVIPKAEWVPLYFGAIDEARKEAGVASLRTRALPEGDVELRTWVGFGKAPLHGYVLRRTAGTWAAFLVEPTGASGKYSRKQAPRETNWSKVWEDLGTAGIPKIRDDSQVRNDEGIADGTSYVVELMQDDEYRTFMVDNPRLRGGPDDSKMLAVESILRRAFGR